MFDIIVTKILVNIVNYLILQIFKKKKTFSENNLASKYIT